MVETDFPTLSLSMHKASAEEAWKRIHVSLTERAERADAPALLAMAQATLCTEARKKFWLFPLLEARMGKPGGADVHLRRVARPHAQ